MASKWQKGSTADEGKGGKFVLEITTAPRLEGTEGSTSVAPRTVDLDTS
jgi:hypothetical protein